MQPHGNNGAAYLTTQSGLLCYDNYQWLPYGTVLSANGS